MLSGLKMEIGAANTINKQKMRCLGKQVTRFQNKILNHYISNRLKHPLLNSYFDNLVIRDADFGGNDVVTISRVQRDWYFWVQIQSRGFASVPTGAFFDFFCFIPSATIKTSYNEKRNSVFPLIFIGPPIGFKLLIQPIKIYSFNKLFIDMPTPFQIHQCDNRVDFFIFQAKIFKNIISYKEVGECLCSSDKTIVFHC